MTIEDVRELVRLQAGDDLTAENSHGINLKHALVPPRRISVIARTVQGGHIRDEKLNVWLVGREPGIEGYKIIMRDDGLQFGLASSGFPSDKCPILTGWYGGLKSAFMSM
jgi:hypothetical protein